MLRNKLFLISMVIGMSAIPVYSAETLSDLAFPKPPAYRVGISEIPEKQYVQAKQELAKPEKKYAQIDDSQESGIADLTYADLSIKRLSKEIAQELEFEEQEMLSDLSLLWQGAAVQSDTINFTLYKLANPDADKPDEKSVKKVLSTIASMSTLVGASMGSPILAGSSLIGGNILGIMSQDTKALNYKYTRVTDADMIILIRKVEDLQQRAINLYYDYMCAKKQLELTDQLVEERQHKFELAQKNNAPRELIVITDAYYRTALDKQRSARSEFFSKRAALEQFVGNQTFLQFEAELLARENGESVQNNTEQAKQAQPSVNNDVPVNETDQEYSNTVQNVENYKNNLNAAEEKVMPSSISSDKSSLESENTNLVNLNTAKPVDQEEDETEVMTGSSSNIEDKDGFKLAFLSKSKKNQDAEDSKSEVSEDNSNNVKPEKKSKEDKYSTKGLIFIHDNDNPKPKRWWETPKSYDNYDEDGLSVEEPSFVNNSPSTSSRRYRVNNEKGNRTEKSQNVNENNTSPVSSKTYSRNEKGSEGYNFEPLEDIKVPDLRPGGYSIHSVPYEEINDGRVPEPSFQY